MGKLLVVELLEGACNCAPSCGRVGPQPAVQLCTGVYRRTGKAGDGSHMLHTQAFGGGPTQVDRNV